MSRQSLLRLIQSIPSARVEPLRQWLAQVGEERLAEVENPEAALERVRAAYRAKGYDAVWIEERIKNDLIRNTLTDEWKIRGATNGTQFAILTNEIHQGTFELSVQAHKKYKILPTRANLRDHMTPLELALTSVGEAMAITYHQDRDSEGFEELRHDAKDAGITAGAARRAIEEQSGKQVISPKNYLSQSRHSSALPRAEQRSLFEELPKE